MSSEPTILLTRSDVASLITNLECIDAVETAFRLYGEGKTRPPSILGIHADRGGFHIKAGIMQLTRNYFVAKANANFPSNRNDFGLPTIQGIIMVSDADNGRLLALTDSIEITILRTGAATAVAAKYLSKEDSQTVTIFGCGNQGRISLKMLAHVRPIKKVWVYDNEHSIAERFADEMSRELSITVNAVEDPGTAVSQSDICVTCTPSKSPYLKKEWLSPGLFIAAVGSDNEDKQELEPGVLEVSKLVTDLTDQCESIGELHHALRSKTLNRDHVYAELGEIVAGKKIGRLAPDEIIVFDSTGMALQDVVSSVIVFEKAIKNAKATRLDFMH